MGLGYVALIVVMMLLVGVLPSVCIENLDDGSVNPGRSADLEVVTWLPNDCLAREVLRPSKIGRCQDPPRVLKDGKIT
jgi:hypothetical protein